MRRSINSMEVLGNAGGNFPPDSSQNDGPRHGSLDAMPAIRAISLKEEVGSCKRLFQIMIEEALDSSKISPLAEIHFAPIARQLDDDLIRVEVWASDIQVDYQDLSGLPLDAETNQYVANVLTDIISQSKAVKSDMRILQSNVKQMSRNWVKNL